MHSSLIILLLSLMLGLQPITTDLYLPAMTTGFGAFMEWFSWRMALLAVAIFGAIFLAAMGLRFRETLARKNLAALQPATVVHTWMLILKHPTFLAFSQLSAASYCGLFTLLVASSFVFIQVLGLSTPMYGVVMLTNSLFYILGTFLCRYWLPRLGVRRAVALAGGLSLSGGTLMAALAVAGWHNVWAILLPQCLFMLGHGIRQPCSQSGAIGPFPQSAGAASGMNGFFMMVAACAIWSVLVALTAWTLVQKYGAIDGH